jgi:thiamine-phosphate pyrophosphorylase
MKNNFITPPPLYAIVSFKEIPNYLDFSKSLLMAKVSWIQLRNKGQISDLDFINVGKEIIKFKNECSPEAKIIINDHLDLVTQIGADGVHLGQTDGSPDIARQMLGPECIIGLSTNNVEQVAKAPLDKVSYLACGPVFNSQTKFGHAPPLGIAGIKEMTGYTNCPFVGIGGITLENAYDVFRAGVKSIAMISELSKHSANLSQFVNKINQIATCNL